MDIAATNTDTPWERRTKPRTSPSTFRLSPPDERDVRWGLTLDLRGDVGIKSGFGAFLNRLNLRSKLARFVEKEPSYLKKGGKRRGNLDDAEPLREQVVDRDGYYLDLRRHCSQVIECSGVEHRGEPTYSMSEVLLGSSADARLIWGAFEKIGDEDVATLARRYRDQEIGGLEAFGDLGSLVLDAKDAAQVYNRDLAIRGSDIGMVGALLALSKRLSTAGADELFDPAVDSDLHNSICVEADQRLSSACREYSDAADEARMIYRVQAIDGLARRRRHG